MSSGENLYLNLNTICLLFPRTAHWTDASPTWQRHSPEEQQPACDNCGHRRHPHRVGRGDRSCDLYPALFSPAEEVSSNRQHEEEYPSLALFLMTLSVFFHNSPCVSYCLTLTKPTSVQCKSIIKLQLDLQILHNPQRQSCVSVSFYFSIDSSANSPQKWTPPCLYSTHLCNCF